MPGQSETESLEGRVFGNLTVISGPFKRDRTKPEIWCDCRCVCGTVKMVRHGTLKKGTTKSCGCVFSTMQTPGDLTGEVFGRLTVIGKPVKENGYTSSPCRCECGVEKLVRNPCLKRGVTKSCGCLKVQKRPDALRSAITAEKKKRYWKAYWNARSEIRAERARKYVDRASDGYIIHLLNAGKDKIDKNLIPDSLIAVYRLQLLIKRKLNEERQ